MGSTLFSIYGFLIGALPVGFMNMGIAIINVYYLVKIYQGKKEYFKLLPIEDSPQYFNHFINFYKTELEKYGFKTRFHLTDYPIRFFILRDMVPAGVFLASKHDETTLHVDLDFVTPEYRDFKTGMYIYEHSKDIFLNQGYHHLISYTNNPAHINYLTKVGFEAVEDQKGKKYFKKTI